MSDKATRKKEEIPVIGLVGGIGSGKSYLARKLAEEGDLAVIDADKIGHEVLLQHEVKVKLRAEFGESIFSEDGEVDRRKLGKLVFGSDAGFRQRRRQLEQIVHPVIRERIQSQIATIRQEGHFEGILLDAAILLESGWQSECQGIAFIEVPEDERLRRVISERKWTSEEFFAREANQLSVESKQRAADITVINFPAGPSAVGQLKQFICRIKDGFTR